MNPSDGHESSSSLANSPQPPATGSVSAASADGEEFEADADDFQSELIQFIHDFDLALIKYITNSSRLPFADDPETWQDFHASCARNTQKYGDYTPKELCHEFISEVLPKIYCYELTAEEMEAFQVLELHPEYRREVDGYERLAKEERPSACHQPKLNVDYSISQEQPFQPTASPRRQDKNFTMAPVPARRLHTVVTSYPVQQQQGGYGFQFSPETHALLSAALSDDLELSGCMLHEPKELHKRMRAAKKKFEQTGRMPKNCLPATELQTKIKKLSELRHTLAHMMDNMFQ